MTTKVALITGVTGQDGAYLAPLLLEKGYVVHGVKRRASSFNTGRVDHLYVDPHEHDTRFFLHHGDLTDATNLIRLVQETQPDGIYNLAAQSHVQVSFETATRIGRRSSVTRRVRRGVATATTSASNAAGWDCRGRRARMSGWRRRNARPCGSPSDS